MRYTKLENHGWSVRFKFWFFVFTVFLVEGYFCLFKSSIQVVKIFCKKCWHFTEHMSVKIWWYKYKNCDRRHFRRLKIIQSALRCRFVQPKALQLRRPIITKENVTRSQWGFRINSCNLRHPRTAGKRELQSRYCL